MASTSESVKKSGDDSEKDAVVTGQSFWTPGRVLLSVIGLGLIVTIGWSRWNSKNVPANNAPTSRAANLPPANNPPPAFVSLPTDLREATVHTLDGESLKLSDFADKVLIVNIWAVWCGPCRLEMPELVKISGEYKSRGLVVLGLATAFRENEAQVKEYVHAQNIPYKIIFDDGTLESPLVQLVQGESVIPQSFLISRDGRIVGHFQGFNPYTTPQKLRQAIEDALNDRGKA